MKTRYLWFFGEDKIPVIVEANTSEEAELKCVKKRVKLAGKGSNFEACLADFYLHDRLFYLGKEGWILRLFRMPFGNMTLVAYDELGRK